MNEKIKNYKEGLIKVSNIIIDYWDDLTDKSIIELFRNNLQKHSDTFYYDFLDNITESKEKLFDLEDEHPNETKTYDNNKDAKLSCKLVKWEGGREDEGRDVERVLQLTKYKEPENNKYKYLKFSTSYYSYDGTQTEYIFDEIRLVKPVTKTIVDYEQ